jgi:hypothetical protein
MICSKCGKESKPEMKFCTKCGTQFNMSTVPLQMAPEVQGHTAPWEKADSVPSKQHLSNPDESYSLPPFTSDETNADALPIETDPPEAPKEEQTAMYTPPAEPVVPVISYDDMEEEAGFVPPAQQGSIPGEAHIQPPPTEYVQPTPQVSESDNAYSSKKRPARVFLFSIIAVAIIGATVLAVLALTGQPPFKDTASLLISEDKNAVADKDNDPPGIMDPIIASDPQEPAGLGAVAVLSDDDEKTDLSHVDEIDIAEEPTPEENSMIGGFWNSDYILLDSNLREITDADLAELSLAELRIARNEIYARHGRQFQDPLLTEWFSAKDWYKDLPQKYSPTVFDQSGLISALESKNAATILNFEENKLRQTSYIFPQCLQTELTEYDVNLSKSVLRRALEEVFVMADVTKGEKNALPEIAKHNAEIIEKALGK